MVAADLNAPDSIMDHPERKSLRAEVNNTTDQIALQDIYGTSPPTAAYYSFLRAHRMLSRIDHISGHENKF